MLVVATVVLAPLAYLTARRNPTSRAIEWMARTWARSVLASTRLSYQVEGRDHFDPQGAYIIVSNHISNLDPMLHFVAVPLPVRFLAKKELFEIPVFGPALRAIGIVRTDRQAGPGGHSTINRQVDQAIAAGRSLVIYAEGTRSRDGRLQKFKKGAFFLAIRAGVPVVPCVIHGTREAWQPGDWRLRGGHARVRFFEPIPTSELHAGDAARLRHQVQEIVADGYRSLQQLSRTPP